MFLLYIFREISRRIHHRKAMRSLSEMDDRMLADLGISRGDIASVVHNGR
jgi:uncharacterized protein YjiS (DUF1127 family)